MLEDQIKNPFHNLPKNACSWGFSGLHLIHVAELADAFAEGEPFDTLWFNSRRWNLSGRVSFDGVSVHCDAYASDDFGGEGYSRVSSPYLPRPEYVPRGEWHHNTNEALGSLVRAEREAKKRLKENKRYKRFFVYEVMSDGRTGPMVEEYILSTAEVTADDDPAKKNSQFGWQNLENYPLPEEVKKEFELWAEDLHRCQSDGKIVPALARDVGAFRMMLEAEQDWI